MILAPFEVDFPSTPIGFPLTRLTSLNTGGAFGADVTTGTLAVALRDPDRLGEGRTDGVRLVAALDGDGDEGSAVGVTEETGGATAGPDGSGEGVTGGAASGGCGGCRGGWRGAPHTREPATTAVTMTVTMTAKITLALVEVPPVDPGRARARRAIPPAALSSDRTDPAGMGRTAPEARSEVDASTLRCQNVAWSHSVCVSASRSTEVLAWSWLVW